MTAENKIIIIGGSIAGVTAATKARRICENAQITIVEESNYIGYHLIALPAFISGNIKKKESLLTNVEENLIEIYNIQVLKNHKAIEINPSDKFIKIKNQNSNTYQNLSYDKLILACGTKFQKPKIEGINLTNIFTLKNIQDAINIKDYIEKTSAKSITLVGANYHSLLTINMLLNNGFNLTLIHDKPDITDDYDSDFNQLINNELIKSGVSVFLDTQIKKIIKNDKNKVSELELSNRLKIKTHLVVFFHPYIPNTDLAQQAELIIGTTGRIKVNQQFMTSNPNIYAIGNIAESYNAITKQPDYAEHINSITMQARIAGANVAGDNLLFSGIFNTKILKLQNLTIGITGLTHHQAIKNGYKTFPFTLFSSNMERYFPYSQKLHFKMIVNEENQKILGIQINSHGNSVDKMLDICSTALYSGLTVNDLANLELSFSPEINSIKDPINTLGKIAFNKYNNYSSPITINEINFQEKYLILDIRSKTEFQKSHIENALWIPLKELRSRLDEVPKDHNIYIYGHIGLRGYIAERLLKGNGFVNVYNIQGGLTAIKLNED